MWKMWDVLGEEQGQTQPLPHTEEQLLRGRMQPLLQEHGNRISRNRSEGREKMKKTPNIPGRDLGKNLPKGAVEEEL